MRSLGCIAATTVAPSRPHIVRADAQPSLDALGWPSTLGDALRRELRRSVGEVCPPEGDDLAWVVSDAGVERVPRAELARAWRRDDLGELVRRLRAVPRGHAAVVLLGDEVAVMAVRAAAWLASSEGR